MAFVSPPPRPVSISPVQKHSGFLWSSLELKSLLLIIRHWNSTGSQSGTHHGRGGIMDTSDFYLDASVASSRPVPTFASLYCKKHRLRGNQFVVSVFWKTIFPRAHFWGYPIFVIWSREFSADREFIAQAGQVETMEQYMEAEEIFHRWPGCRSFLRGTLGLRVSSRRLRRLVTELFAEANRTNVL
jgi:hypothetical protein